MHRAAVPAWNEVAPAQRQVVDPLAVAAAAPLPGSHSDCAASPLRPKG
ncbi:MAG TPA: hypothetical protein VGM06_23915 [Polyangiaceae bacterium]